MDCAAATPCWGAAANGFGPTPYFPLTAVIEQRQTQVTETVQAVMAPLVRWLVQEGVGYAHLQAALKPVFIEQALAQIVARGEKDTDSALSLRSGIHRKDISAWRQSSQGSFKPVKRSISAEVFACWISDPAYADEQGPQALPRSGPAPSFEALAQQISKDVHPLTVLNELLRLGLVSLEPDAQGGDLVVLRSQAFIPQNDWTQTVDLLRDNLRAHIESAVANLGGQQAPRLEQAAYAGGLSHASAQALSQLSRQLWAQMLKTFLTEAQRLRTRDQALGPCLVRLGVYFHDEQLSPDAAADPEEKP